MADRALPDDVDGPPDDALPDVLRRIASGPLPPGFVRREVTVGPSASLPYVDADWHEALIVVVEGEVEVVCRAGGHRRFTAGDTLWFDGLEVATLVNPSAGALVLAAVSRTV